MKPHRLSVLVAFLAAVACVRGGEAIALGPDATLRFEFPELPDTLASLSSRQEQPPVLTARLPENYSRRGEFGLVVFLGGGEGGRGTDPAEARAIVGPRDYVCVSMPLFKRALDRREPAAGLMVAMDDFDTISRAYRAMLGKLYEVAPNIRPERSAMGGFSNGAHTTAVLLAGQDEFVLDHFRLFYFADGGMGPLAANMLQKTAMKRCRFLVLCGEKPAGDPDRESCLLLTRGLAWAAQDCKVDLATVVMRGHGHEFPAKYRGLVGRWVRGERLAEAEPVAPLAAPAAQAGATAEQ